MEIGDRIVHQFTVRHGLISDMMRVPAPMVEVRWDDTGEKQRMPIAMIRLADYADVPTITKTGLGRTAPAYLVELRRKIRKENTAKCDERTRPGSDPKNLADYLAKLNPNKQKTKNKVKKIRAAYGDAIQVHGRQGR
jgi:hypothetical protein